jgi:hypothetical protein
MVNFEEVRFGIERQGCGFWGLGFGLVLCWPEWR